MNIQQKHTLMLLNPTFLDDEHEYEQSQDTQTLFFYRKWQRDILIKKMSTKEGWGILPPKKTKLQEYKNKKIHSKNKQTL